MNTDQDKPNPEIESEGDVVGSLLSKLWKVNSPGTAEP